MHRPNSTIVSTQFQPVQRPGRLLPGLAGIRGIDDSLVLVPTAIIVRQPVGYELLPQQVVGDMLVKLEGLRQHLVGALVGARFRGRKYRSGHPS